MKEGLKEIVIEKYSRKEEIEESIKSVEKGLSKSEKFLIDKWFKFLHKK